MKINNKQSILPIYSLKAGHANFYYCYTIEKLKFLNQIETNSLIDEKIMG